MLLFFLDGVAQTFQNIVKDLIDIIQNTLN